MRIFFVDNFISFKIGFECFSPGRNRKRDIIKMVKFICSPESIAGISCPARESRGYDSVVNPVVRRVESRKRVSRVFFIALLTTNVCSSGRQQRDPSRI